MFAYDAVAFDMDVDCDGFGYDDATAAVVDDDDDGYEMGVAVVVLVDCKIGWDLYLTHLNAMGGVYSDDRDCIDCIVDIDRERVLLVEAEEVVRRLVVMLLQVYQLACDWT